MTETTQEERDQIIQRLAESDINVSDEVCGLICDAVQDADRLAAIERQVRAKADEMDYEAWSLYHDGFESFAMIRQQDALDLRVILDSPEGD